MAEENSNGHAVGISATLRRRQNQRTSGGDSSTNKLGNSDSPASQSDGTDPRRLGFIVEDGQRTQSGRTDSAISMSNRYSNDDNSRRQAVYFEGHLPRRQDSALTASLFSNDGDVTQQRVVSDIPAIQTGQIAGNNFPSPGGGAAALTMQPGGFEEIEPRAPESVSDGSPGQSPPRISVGNCIEAQDVSD